MEKDPKDPREGNYLDLCRKDFRNFKEKNGKDILEFLGKLIKEQEGRGNKPDLIRNQKMTYALETDIEKILGYAIDDTGTSRPTTTQLAAMLSQELKLIKEGNDIKAFSNFHRTFPYGKDQDARIIKPTVLIQQKENLKNVRKLINEGNERTAFSLFHRTFPYCMPYRSI